MGFYFIQPYYGWRGHFKKYTDSLIATTEEAILVSGRRFKNVFDYTWLRFYFSVVSIFKLSKKAKSVDQCYFLEFEPLSFFIFYPFIIRFNKVFFTIHAVSVPDLGNSLVSYLVRLQRMLFNITVRLYSRMPNVIFIVHSNSHKVELSAINGISPTAKISIIDYPCPIPEQIIMDNDILDGFEFTNILCFGAMRSDKQLAPFIKRLAEFGNRGFRFVFSGVVSDPGILNIKDNLPEFITINDEFIDDETLLKLTRQSRYLLVPYGSSYTGGAGPLKDAASFGKPCLVSNLPLFREINDTANYCISFSSIDDLYNKLESVNVDKYIEMVRNAIRYSEKNNWSTLRERYVGLS